MEKKQITKESALLRFKKALQHKKDIQASIEKEYASIGQSVKVTFL